MCNKIKAKIEEYKLKKERGEKGFNYQDLWNMDTYLLTVFSSMLYELAKTTYSYPKEIENLEKWQEFLIELSNNFIKVKKAINKGNYGPDVEELFRYTMEQFTDWFFCFWE